jgi:hypothetical protein
VHHALERTITEPSARFAVPDPGHDAVIDADHWWLPWSALDNPDEPM